MNGKELLLSLKKRTESLPTLDDAEKEAIVWKVKLYSEKFFGSANKYGIIADNINFWVINGNESQKREEWELGKKKLLNLIDVMIEDFDLSE